jgi:hypothetical protein
MYVAFRSAKMPTFAERTATSRENPASKSLTSFGREANDFDIRISDFDILPRVSPAWTRERHDPLDTSYPGSYTMVYIVYAVEGHDDENRT